MLTPSWALEHLRKQTVHSYKLHGCNAVEHVAFSLLNNQAWKQNVTVGIVWIYIWSPDVWIRWVNLLTAVLTITWDNYTWVSGWHDWGSKIGNFSFSDSNCRELTLDRKHSIVTSLSLFPIKNQRDWRSDSQNFPHPEIFRSTLLRIDPLGSSLYNVLLSQFLVQSALAQVLCGTLTMAYKNFHDLTSVY